MHTKFVPLRVAKSMDGSDRERLDFILLGEGLPKIIIARIEVGDFE